MFSSVSVSSKAQVAELADAVDSKSTTARFVGSTPTLGTSLIQGAIGLGLKHLAGVGAGKGDAGIREAAASCRSAVANSQLRVYGRTHSTNW